MRPLRMAVLAVLAYASPLFAIFVGPQVPAVNRLVTMPAPFQRNMPEVASNGSEFLVVWNDVRPLGQEVRGTRVSATGEILDPASLVIGRSGNQAAVASDGRHYMVAYNCSAQLLNGVCLARVDADTGAFAAAGLIPGGTNPKIASNGSGYMVVYQASRTNAGLGLETVRGVGVTSEGRVGTPFLIGDATYAPDIASNGDDYYVLYATNGGLTGVLLSDAGVIRADRPLSGPAGFGPAAFGWSVASNGEGFLVAWQQNTGVVSPSYTTALQAREVSADGTPGPTRTLVSTGHAWDPEVTRQGSRYLVSYTASDAPATAPYRQDMDTQVKAVVYDDLTVSMPVQTLTDRPVRDAVPAGAGNGGKALLVWERTYAPGRTQIFGHLIPGTDLTVAGRFVVSHSINWQDAVTAAKINGAPVVAWSENGAFEDQSRRVRLTRVDAQGRPVSPDLTGPHETSRDQLRPALGGDALVFIEQSIGGADPAKVRLQFFLPWVTGGVNEIGNAARDSRVSVAAAGETHMVVWESPEHRILAFRLSVRDGFIDDEPLVLSGPASSSPTVVSNGESFFVAWNVEKAAEGCGVCLPLHSLHAAVVSASGVVTRQEFEVAETITGESRLVSDGTSYSILWNGLEQETGTYYRAAQTFSAVGNPVTGRVLLPVDGILSSVTEADGGYLVVVENSGRLDLARFDEGFRLLEVTRMQGPAVPGTSTGIMRGAAPGTYVVAHQAPASGHGISSRAVSRIISDQVPNRRQRSIRR